MAKKKWNRITPNSLKHALELCLEHARVEKRLKVEAVADLLGLSSRSNLYKWLSNGRLPANYIKPIEHICGIDYITRYLASSGYKLLIDIPRGRKIKATDLIALQTGFNDSLNLLAKFHEGGASADETIDALTATLTEIALHRENVVKAAMPELPLFDMEGEE